MRAEPGRAIAHIENATAAEAVRMRLARLAGRSFPDFPGKNRIVRRLLPRHSKAAAFEAPFFGTRYRGTPGDYIDSQVWAYGGYELGFVRAWTQAFKAFAGEPVLFVDVGANTGHHAIALAPLCREVIAFEAHPDLYKILGERVGLSGRPNARTVWAAVSDRDGSAMLTDLARLGNRGMSSLVADVRGHPAARAEKLIEVPCLRLDTYFGPVTGQRIFIKIDVEGAEHAVVRGAARLMRRNRVAVHIESHDVSAIGALLELGFRGHSLNCWYRHFYLSPLDPAAHSDHLLSNFDFGNPNAPSY